MALDHDGPDRQLGRGERERLLGERQVHAEDLAAGCLGNAHRQQAQQAQPDHTHLLAELRLSQAEAVQGDGAAG